MFQCLFDEDVSQRIGGMLKIRPLLLDGTMRQFEQDMQDNRDTFLSNSARANLLTFLYWCKGSSKLEEMGQLNEAILKRDTTNVPALKCKASLLDSVSTQKARNLRRDIRRLQSQSDEVWHGLDCEGEIAYACRCIGSALHDEAIDRYEGVIRKFEKELKPAQKDEMMRSKKEVVCSWYYYAAETRNRQLIYGWKLGESHISPAAEFQVIAERLNFVIDKQSEEYRRKAVVELANAWLYCRTHYEPELVFPRDEGADAVVDQVADEANVEYIDPSALEKCGIYYRRSACDQIDRFEKALHIFKRCPGRAVSLHQMGLIHRRLNTLRRETNMSEAIACFKRAHELRPTNIEYLVSLASVCSKNDEAATYLNRAREVLDDGHMRDTFRLYSSWDDYHRGNATAEVANMYRKAIRAGLLTKIRDYIYRTTLDSFHSILQKQSGTSEREARRLDTEKFIVKSAIDAFDHETVNDNPLTILLKTKESVLAATRQLVPMMFSETDEDDHNNPTGAFLYLTALVQAKKIDLEIDELSGLMPQIADRIYCSEMQSFSGVKNWAMRDVFRWLVGNEAIGKKLGTEIFPESSFKEHYDVCVFGPNNITQTGQIMKMLQDHLGLFVAHEESFVAAWDLIDQSLSVIVILKDDEDMTDFTKGLDRLSSDETIKVWLIQEQQQSGSKSCVYERQGNRVKLVSISPDSKPTEMAMALVTVFLLPSYPQSGKVYFVKSCFANCTQ